ncbi:MAG TPA: 3-dehydroquinate synthase, partial [Gammaproteobacteria bacterium]
RARLPVKAPPSMTEQQFLDLMAVDKKVLDGGLRLVLLKAIGEAVISGDFQPRHLHETLAAAL